ncbi:MAG: hypothetical protein KA795_01675 [Burkholderiaceae bacterium]|nr:hypothetical protein [Burkholderiaceae bacterium]
MPAPFLMPIATATAALALRGDVPAVKVRVARPRGSLYWGGAGLDGPYIRPQLEAFQAAGLRHVHTGLTNTASQHLGKNIGALLDAMRSGALIRFEDEDDWTIVSGMDGRAPQFNLIGYSYGSLLAAQTANSYARKGHVVDHLVLIGSPIDITFLASLQANRCIRKVIVVDLTEHGDPIHAGISQVELLQAVPLLKRQQDRDRGEGHFYYAHVVPDSPRRWKQLSELLVRSGLA